MSAHDMVCISGLPDAFNDVQCQAVFGAYAVISQCTVLPPQMPGLGSTALVRFGSARDATWVVEKLNNSIAQGLDAPISVMFANPASVNTSYGKMTAKGNPMHGNSPYSSGSTESSGVTGGQQVAVATAMQQMMAPKGGGKGGVVRKNQSMGSATPGYKTQMCKFFKQSGTCDRGSNCTYAHGAHELKSFYLGGQISTSSWNKASSRSASAASGKKSELCKFFQQTGRCSNGAACKKAHGTRELAR
eukprot:gnl/TRDRNA2_/TRDRNA2_165539_c0_seq1.p1 gnl/TRDRNA2_/TRDRNA2_165539_c0~~gnl/TRDRNA2_/TRDRNA2_165539_c0_seq1.p1  ORF type:complete len:277 (+),score=37.39 gnl/TRDRNA2_/TRDRNA2_165539_c0_seq1:96-833(+)